MVYAPCHLTIEYHCDDESEPVCIICAFQSAGGLGMVKGLGAGLLSGRCLGQRDRAASASTIFHSSSGPNGCRGEENSSTG